MDISDSRSPSSVPSKPTIPRKREVRWSPVRTTMTNQTACLFFLIYAMLSNLVLLQADSKRFPDQKEQFSSSSASAAL